MRKKKRPAKPLTEKQRVADEQLREALRKADLKTFDRALSRAIKASHSGLGS
jgi:hypothetical protein